MPRRDDTIEATKWKSGKVEKWNGGKVEWWKGGMVERWKSGMVEKWKGWTQLPHSITRRSRRVGTPRLATSLCL